MASMSWEDIAKKKREALAARIPEHWRIPKEKLPSESERSVISFCSQSNILTREELLITELSVEQLAKKISTGQYTAVEVCQAYCHRAAIAHQLVNCLSEIHFNAALEQAKELDEYFQKNGKTVGLLHGIPVSLKDQFRVKGLDSAIGFVGRVGEIDQEESVITECLRRAGAIIYVKTSVPQSLMIGETVNNIYGRTLNPYNRLLSCGGSSGGEGALIALHGSPLGVGTDIGGSVRIPAAFNFLWGIKSSHGRVPMSAVSKSLDGQEAIRSICGLFAHSSTDLVYFMKAILNQEPWSYDPDVIDLPWRQSKYSEGKTDKKTFGIIVCDGIYGYDGVVMPHPPILRGIQMLMKSLKEAGHTVVEWEPYKHGHGVMLFQSMLAGDGGVTLKKSLEKSGEPAIPFIKAILAVPKPSMYVADLWALHVQRTAYQKEYLEKWRQQSHIDAWILPVAPHAAVEHDQYKYYGYSTILNVLDWPAVVIPVTFADQNQDIKITEYQSRSDLDMTVHQNYDADIYHGAPVAVQLVGRRLQEEYLLGLAEQVHQALISTDQQTNNDQISVTNQL